MRPKNSDPVKLDIQPRGSVQTGMNPVSKIALDNAEAYGRRFECEFKYYPERYEGVFWKFVPAM
uniref:Uncharacterized protein n=1 Tax=Rhizobium leguminosarum TaxID=384 RepID=A0A179BAG6_RHILE|nr:hypothetical protein A4U53_35285 [Rhizobium leguminosarum]